MDWFLKSLTKNFTAPYCMTAASVSSQTCLIVMDECGKERRQSMGVGYGPCQALSDLWERKRNRCCSGTDLAKWLVGSFWEQSCRSRTKSWPSANNRAIQSRFWFCSTIPRKCVRGMWGKAGECFQTYKEVIKVLGEVKVYLRHSWKQKYADSLPQ